MQVRTIALTAGITLAAAGPTLAGDLDFALSIAIGGTCAPLYGYGYGFDGYAYRSGLLCDTLPYGGWFYNIGGYGYRTYAYPGIFGSTVVYRTGGYRVVYPRSYFYAHRGYDRYAYGYGYHYPGRHYAYSYGYRFTDVHPRATLMIRTGRIRDYGHAYRTHRRTILRHGVTRYRRTTRHIYHR